mmetsp:Transcript_39240/g.95391  ORF Transcript_39240/g.95391 Transcript_39240/m.95391 type:complete len:442 (-) Transcript_39240:88-1413(-)
MVGQEGPVQPLRHQFAVRQDRLGSGGLPHAHEMHQVGADVARVAPEIFHLRPPNLLQADFRCIVYIHRNAAQSRNHIRDIKNSWLSFGMYPAWYPRHDHFQQRVPGSIEEAPCAGVKKHHAAIIFVGAEQMEIGECMRGDFLAHVATRLLVRAQVLRKKFPKVGALEIGEVGHDGVLKRLPALELLRRVPYRRVFKHHLQQFAKQIELLLDIVVVLGTSRFQIVGDKAKLFGAQLPTLLLRDVAGRLVLGRVAMVCTVGALLHQVPNAIARPTHHRPPPFAPPSSDRPSGCLLGATNLVVSKLKAQRALLLGAVLLEVSNLTANQAFRCLSFLCRHPCPQRRSSSRAGQIHPPWRPHAALPRGSTPPPTAAPLPNHGLLVPLGRLLGQRVQVLLRCLTQVPGAGPSPLPRLPVPSCGVEQRSLPAASPTLLPRPTAEITTR